MHIRKTDCDCATDMFKIGYTFHKITSFMSKPDRWGFATNAKFCRVGTIQYIRRVEASITCSELIISESEVETIDRQ
jgi:hypothetical protein